MGQRGKKSYEWMTIVENREKLREGAKLYEVLRNY